MPAVIERWFIPAGRRAARRIEPSWQKLAVGDEVADWGGSDATLRLAELDPPRSLVWLSTRDRRKRPPLNFSWALVLRDTAAGECELLLRLRIDLAGGRKWLARYGGGALDWVTVKLLERGLRERVSQPDGRSPAPRPSSA
jgi:hypothetical protein